MAKTVSMEEDAQTGLIRPDIVAPGLSIVSADNKSTTGYVAQSGTSMAAPCVTGIVALMKEKNPDITPAQICEILETTAVKLSEKKNNQTGSGRIDALAAIQMVKDEDENDDVQDTTNIIKNEYEFNIAIYPNPVENELFLATELQVKEIAIYDIYGRTVSQHVNMSTRRQVVNVADLEAGVYFVKVVTNEGKVVKRFIKN